MEEAITVTRTDLERALRTWDAQAAAEQWPERTDDDRHRDNADYLFGLLNNG